MLTNKKHIAFVDAYMANGHNAAAAYRIAYPSVKTESSEVLGSKLLRNIKVADEIAQRQSVVSKKFEIKKEDLMLDLLKIKENCFENLPPSAIKAIEVLNKMLGYDAPTKIEHSGDININLILPGLEEESEDENAED